MSVSIQTVDFQREAVLSSLSEGPPWTVNGIALGAGDVTLGQSGIKKVWPAEELEKAAATLQGKNLVVDHENDSGGVVGQVTKAGYKNGVGVIYEAELFDEDLADKINNGLLEVSIRGYHTDVDEMEENEEGAKVVTGIKFDNLSIVPTGASPSNTLEMGEHEELTAAELAAFVSELQEIEPGMWVMSGDTHGITISPVEDGEVEVDIYEESNDKWRSTGETEMMDVNSLKEWDVDEEEDIGAMEDEEDGDEEENAVTTGDAPVQDSSSVADRDDPPRGVPSGFAFISEEDAMMLVEEEDGLTGVHQMDGWWVPGVDHKEFTQWMSNQRISASENEELAAEGDKVQWDSSGGMARGVVVDRQTNGCFEERIDGDVKVCAEDGDAALLINVVQESDTDGKWEKSGTMVAHKESTVEETDFSMLSKHKMDEDVDDDMESEQAPEWKEGDLVQWQVEPQLFGKIVHVDEKRGIVMVEIHERMDGELETTHFTISAGFSDLKPLDHGEGMSGHAMDEEEMAESYDDYPEAAKENAQMALDAREETGNPNDCGTDVGWRRANQLADGEALSRDVIAKMSAFNRHRSNSDMDDDEGKADCGWMMWKAWGGDEGVDWANRKLDQIEEENGIDLRDAEELKVEGEDEPYTNTKKRDDGRNSQPERYPDGEAEELQDYSMHDVSFDGTTEQDWSSPDLEDFMAEMDLDAEQFSDLTDAQKGQIADHFIISQSSFPPENFGDLKLPVVEPSGELNVNALSAVKGGRGVTAVEGLGEEMEDSIREMVNDLANEEFDRDWGMEENSDYKRSRTIDDTGDEPGVADSGPVDISLELINKYLRIEGNHERDKVDGMLSWMFGATDLPTETMADFRMASKRFLDETPGTDSFSGLTVEQFRDWLLMHGDRSAGQREMDNKAQRGELPPGKATPVHVLTGDDFWKGDKSRESELDNTTKVINMTEDIEQKLAELNEPVAVEQSDLEELQQKADRFEEMSATLESLKERTDILDSVDREQVEELADSESPMVVESTRYEELEGEAEQVKMVYASALAEQMPGFEADELAEGFDIESLREKYEAQVGELEEELSPEPKSGDVDEEDLEERADEGSEEELEPSETEQAEEMRDDLREKIRAGL